MAGTPARPATQVPPSPQKESTNWHIPAQTENQASGLSQPAQPRWTFRLKRERERLLEQVLDPREEFGAVGAVEDSVIAHEREHHLVAGDQLALVVHGRLLLELPDGEDRGLGRIDDRRELLDAEHPEVGDGERAA